CAASDTEVTLVAPLATDQPGRRLAAMLRSDVTLVPLPHEGPTRHKSRVLSRGQVVVRLDGGGPGTPADPPLEPVERALRGADVVLVSDYGAGVTRDPGLRGLLSEAARRVPVIWDPHPRGGSPVPGTIVTPNLSEARASTGAWLRGEGAAEALALELCERWGARAVCVTAGSDGAYLAVPGCAPMFLPAP